MLSQEEITGKSVSQGHVSEAYNTITHACVSIKAMKPRPEMNEGPEALKRFEDGMKALFSAKKNDLPPSPFGKSSKSSKKKRKPESPKG